MSQIGILQGGVSIKRSRALGEIDLTSVSGPAQGFSSELVYLQAGANQKERRQQRNEAKQGCLLKQDLAVCM